MADFESYDYVIVGGGTAGCVVAHRLSNQGHSVVVVEAGPENHGEVVMDASRYAELLRPSEFTRHIPHAPQPHLNNRRPTFISGKLLGGSSAINTGNWLRAHSADYDEWAEVVGDSRWSYQGMLPYFKRVETHYDSSASTDIHGFDGPMHTASGLKRFPLREPIKEALSQAGLPFKKDINDGNPQGFGAFTENWRDGRRQPSGKVYDLSKATVMTNAPVHRLIIEPADMTVVGAKLVDGREIRARREVIVSAGTAETAKLLMLSGIGPADHLSALGVPVLRDLPVGNNLHDHLAALLYFELKNPGQGLVVGDPLLTNPALAVGVAVDWIAFQPIDNAKETAKAYGVPADDVRVRQPRLHTETFVANLPAFAFNSFKDPNRLNGTHFSTVILGVLPRSNGTVRLASTDPTADPIIDPQYLSVPFDREALRTGYRTMLRTMLDTPSGQSFVARETPPDGMEPITSAATDAEIDARIARTGMTFWHYGGTASMGTVVDTRLRVKGVSRLRVVDASIFPVPLAGHYQYPVYAMAESASDLILEDAALSA